VLLLGIEPRSPGRPVCSQTLLTELPKIAVSKLLASWPRMHSPPRIGRLLTISKQYSVANVGRLRVLNCLLSLSLSLSLLPSPLPLRCSCCNIVWFCCDTETCNYDDGYCTVLICVQYPSVRMEIPRKSTKCQVP
jgi:hypothetical protein